MRLAEEGVSSGAGGSTSVSSGKEEPTPPLGDGGCEGPALTEGRGEAREPKGKNKEIKNNRDDETIPARERVTPIIHT